MDKKKPRDPKETLAFLKEWVSDNLRYILLAAAIVIIVLIIIFALSSSPIKNADSPANNQTSTTTENNTKENGLATEDKTASSAESTASSEEKSTAAESTASSDDKSEASGSLDLSEENTAETANAETNAASATVNSGTENEAPAGSQLVVASPEVAATVETYLTALAAGDVDSAASVCENLTEAEISAITSGVYPSPMEHIVCYSYPGSEDGTYVVIARFDATDRNTLVSVPACGAYYLITADTGAILVASADTTAAHQSELDEVVAYPAVAQLIADVANAAQAVTAATAQ